MYGRVSHGAIHRRQKKGKSGGVCSRLGNHLLERDKLARIDPLRKQHDAMRALADPAANVISVVQVGQRGSTQSKALTTGKIIIKIGK